jgi:hypothetical protein
VWETWGSGGAEDFWTVVEICVEAGGGGFLIFGQSGVRWKLEKPVRGVGNKKRRQNRVNT